MNNSQARISNMIDGLLLLVFISNIVSPQFPDIRPGAFKDSLATNRDAIERAPIYLLAEVSQKNWAISKSAWDILEFQQWELLAYTKATKIRVSEDDGLIDCQERTQIKLYRAIPINILKGDATNGYTYFNSSANIRKIKEGGRAMVDVSICGKEIEIGIYD